MLQFCENNLFIHPSACRLKLPRIITKWADISCGKLEVTPP